jgi:iron complex transport system permease protein
VQTTNPATNKSSSPASPSNDEGSFVVLKEETKHAQPPTSDAQWRRGVIALPLLFGGLLVALVFATAIGSVHISASETSKILLNSTGLFHFRRTWDPIDETIIFQLRLPRVLGAALVGTGLAVAGVLFQGLLRNPLADPYLIGTSAGAGLGATIAILLPAGLLVLGESQVTVFSFVGAMAAVLLVYWLARVGGRTPVVSLLLAGVVVTTLMSACQALLIYLVPDAQLKFRSVYAWLSGGIAVDSWNQVGIAAVLVFIGLAASFGFSVTLNALALGEEGAAYLGVNVERQKTLLIIIASLLTAATVSIAGLVSFVGLVVPHSLRLILGPGHRLLIPASALGGAIFLVLTDMLARTIIAPAELPLGVLTSLVGGPFFLYLLRRSSRDYRW